MRLDHIPPFVGKKELVRVVIEAPKGCRNKYAYEPEFKAIVLKKTLPQGMIFPFDFGLIPQTRGGDGDPLDVLVLMDAPTFPGCVVECRLVGLIEAIQKEDGEKTRNDRFIAVAETSLIFQDVKDASDVPPAIIKQIEQFFVSYNQLAGKRFKPLRVLGAKLALKHLKTRFTKQP
jgi:inorganic pyrophosphatase